MTSCAPTLWRPLALALRVFAACLLVFASVSAGAEEEVGGVRWQDLTPAQQEVLQRFESRWDQLPLARQRALARGAERWASMTPEERAQAKEHWRSMDPEERRKMRERFREFKSLPPEQQDRIRKHYERFQALPPEKRRELRERFHKLSPEERQRLRERILAGEKEWVDEASAQPDSPVEQEKTRPQADR